ncbi:MAG TPA: glycogen synthase GlgA [Armatimonadetes bacterium]|nr:glycogen synthase GlgA [Armatimonadota bacterium]
MNSLKVLFVAAEVVPFAKAGGLADVAGSLPKALQARGLEVRVVLPYYRHVKRYFAQAPEPPEFRPQVAALKVPLGESKVSGMVHWSELPASQVPIYFLENEALYDRPELYGERGRDYPDSAERFAYLCRGALELCAALNWEPEVVHCHDWHTGLIPLYLRYDENTPFCASVYTIHNLAYQGWFAGEHLTVTGVSRWPKAVEDLLWDGRLNFMRAGLLNADCLNTVSKRYAEEIQTPRFGCGLEDLLHQRREVLFGILNGIDYARWNPATDPYLPAHYRPGKLEGKKVCKQALQEEFGLPVRAEVPLFGMVTRLATQKGLDLVAAVLDRLVARGAQFVLLGTGEPQFHEMFSQIAQRYPRQTGIRLAYDAPLANRIYAGSDFLLMPSQYEPCGLGQLISLAYGTIPIVRATGGLADTITEQGNRPNGFVFEEYDPEAFWRAIERGLAAYQDRKRWEQLMANAMSYDFSWEASAVEYERLYRYALERRAGSLKSQI